MGYGRDPEKNLFGSPQDRKRFHDPGIGLVCWLVSGIRIGVKIAKKKKLKIWGIYGMDLFTWRGDRSTLLVSR